VAGTVTDTSTGAGIADVSVAAYAADGSYLASATTAANGGYTIRGLNTGSIYLRTTNSQGTSTSSTTTSRVRAEAARSPREKRFLSRSAWRPRASTSASRAGRHSRNHHRYRRWRRTERRDRFHLHAGRIYAGLGYSGPTGAYTAGGLLAGTYYAKTANALGYIDELFDNQQCAAQSCALTGGTPISVTVGQTTTGINFGLARGGTITGKVTDASTTVGVSGVYVYVYTLANVFTGFSQTSAGGSYTIAGCRPGPITANVKRRRVPR